MDTRTVLSYEMLARVKDYGASRTTDFPANSPGGQLFAELAATVPELSHLATLQTGAIGEALVSSATKARLRVSVRADLRFYCRTARVITAGNPDLAKKFRLPKAGDQNLLSAARAFLADAEPLAAEFPKHEVPAEALAKFRADIDEFEAAMSDRNQKTESRVRATARVKALLSRGKKVVLKLDVIVRNKYRNDKPNVASWESARHVEQQGPRTKDQPTTDQGKVEPTHIGSGAAAGK